MSALKKMKALVLIFAFLVLFVGAFTIASTEDVSASYACCIWVMYCTIDEPAYCWCECIPVPCFW